MTKLTHIVATDLDGTLFNADSEISSQTLQALKLANGAGYHTIAVTGRSWRTATDRLKPASGIDYLICSNGAYLFRQSKNGISWENTISQEEVATLAETVKLSVPDACFGWESRSGLFFEPRFRELATGPGYLEHGGTAGELGSEALFKLFIRSAVHNHHALLDILHPDTHQIATVTSSGAPFLEATSSSADKGSALARLAAELGVPPENTIAFGDNLNDLTMLAWAGTSVAMDNALPEVKAIASDTTRSNTEHGVAYFLEKLLSQRNTIK